MQLISLEKGRSTQLFYLVAMLLGALLVLTAKQDDPGVVAAGVILAIASIYPLYFWLLGWSHGLPIWPVFVASNGVIAALPMIQDSENLAVYTSGEIIAGGFTFVGFFALGTVIWLSLTARQGKPPANVVMIAREHSERYLFGFIVAGLLFYLNQLGGIIPLPGNTMQLARGVTGSLSTLGIFVLAFYDGQGLLKRPQSIWLAVLATMTTLAAAAGLIMATAIVPVAMLLMGYALGSGKVPWRALAVVLIVATILHPGKFAMRALYWGPDRPAFRLTVLPQFYLDWFGHGMEHFAGITGLDTPVAKEDEVSSLFERSGNLHMLLLVQKKSPDEVPFLNGLTYEPIPRLLIPRFLDDEKGISHAGNILLTVNYGVQTIEQTAGTSIGWGLVPEAYANFGYMGVAGLAVVLAIFYSWMTNISVGVPMTSLRFVLGLLIMGAATRADTMGVFITTQFQGIVGVSLAAMMLMRRQPNPFAEEQEMEVKSGKVGRWEGRQQGARSEEQGAREESARVGRLEGGKVGEGGRDTASAAPRDVGTGGTVRTMPIRTPKRIARWMPRRIRAAVVAAARSAEETGDSEQGTAEAQNGSGVTREAQRPRQVAVPYQNYRRYRA
jgi:hypothetical protein